MLSLTSFNTTPASKPSRLNGPIELRPVRLNDSALIDTSPVNWFTAK